MNVTKDLLQFTFLWGFIVSVVTEKIPLPSFSQLKQHYPGYYDYGGNFHKRHLLAEIGCSLEILQRDTEASHLRHDTSALRLSYALNKLGGVHSIGKQPIRLSRSGEDSVTGRQGLQYIYHPIAYGPYLADKYGYPTVSKLHEFDPISMEKNFWGKQGILRVITYRKKERNLPVGHVALWDCNHFHQSKDWIKGHSLITVEFWEAPDSDCSHSTAQSAHTKATRVQGHTQSAHHHPSSLQNLLRDEAFRQRFEETYVNGHGRLRHPKRKGFNMKLFRQNL